MSNKNNLPSHVKKAMREGWKSWCLVETKSHERHYEAYMRLNSMEAKPKELDSLNRSLKARLSRPLSLKERLTGRLKIVLDISPKV